MSFSDHSYGEQRNKEEEAILFLVKKFVSQASGELNDKEDNAADKNKFITSLETLIENLHSKLKHLKKSQNIENNALNVKDGELVQVQADNDEIERLVQVQADNDETERLVQVHADNDEIERRIAAFMQRKQLEVDGINKREFCSSFGSLENEESCARTDSVYIPSPGSRSHVRISRVINRMGPGARKAARNAQNDDSLLNPTTRGANVEERVHCMETHLNLDNSRKMKIFERVQQLEERILKLESISPEYLNVMSPVKKRSRIDDSNSREGTDHVGHSNSSHSSYNKSCVQYHDLSLPQIDERILALKQQLKAKVVKQLKVVL